MEKVMPNEESKNLVTLRDLVEEKFRAIDKSHDLLRDSINARFEAGNQWREESKMRAMHYMTREEFQQMHERVLEDIRYLREAKASVDGKASQLAFQVTFLVAFLGLLLATVEFFMRPR
jgi:hypothetical protein